MERTRLRFRVILTLIVTFWSLIQLWPDTHINAQPSASPPTYNRQPYALTISGGASLGSYEAGLNWVILKDFRRREQESEGVVPQLVGITGASAGAINALLSALSWCSEGDEIGTLDNNLFREAWLPIGFNTLLPRNGEPYEPDDGWLTRNAFDEITRDIMDLVDSGRFREGCSIALGLTITRPDPAPMLLDGIRVMQQRVVLPLEMRIKGRRPQFLPFVSKTYSDLLGDTIYLASRNHDSQNHGSQNQTGVLDFEDVIGAVLASAAFPFAFGPVSLVECLPVPPGKEVADVCPTERQTRGWNCSYVEQQLAQDGFRVAQDGLRAVPCIDYFIDGGVFDNVPLGVAVAQVESSSHVREMNRPVTYLYLEPDNRRTARPVDMHRPSARPTTVDSNLTFFGGAVRTARSYVLHDVLRYNSWNEHAEELGVQAAKLLEKFSGTTVGHGEDELRLVIDLAKFLDIYLPNMKKDERLQIACPTFSWDRRALSILDAMDCVDAIISSPGRSEKELKHTYAAFASRALMVIAENLRQARQWDPSKSAYFDQYRRQLLTRITRLGEQMTEMLPTSVNIQKIMSGINNIVMPVLVDEALKTYMLQAISALAQLNEIKSKLPMDSEERKWADKAAGEVFKRHRCAAVTLAVASDIANLATMRVVGASKEDVQAANKRVEAIRSATAKLREAATCAEAPGRVNVIMPVQSGLSRGQVDTIDQGAPSSELESRPHPSPELVSELVRALGIAQDNIDSCTKILMPYNAAWHKIQEQINTIDWDIYNVEEYLENIEKLERLSEAARRKLGNVHEDRALAVSTRFAPLASSYVSAFSGFLDEPLREYDYLVGVYDGLYMLGEELCLRNDLSTDDKEKWSECVDRRIGELLTELKIENRIVSMLKSLEFDEDTVRQEPLPNHGNVERVLNALFDPKRCGTDGQRSRSSRRCLVDRGFNDFIAALKRRNYRTKNLYMQRALSNPDEWWVTPLMFTLRRMESLEEGKDKKSGWHIVSATTQRLLVSLEDRMTTGWTVPSALPPTIVSRDKPWVRFSLTMDGRFPLTRYSRLDGGENIWRLRPIGYAIFSGRLAFYADTGIRISGWRDFESFEGGFAVAWRNIDWKWGFFYGAQLAMHADVARSRNARIDASATLVSHLRIGLGYDNKDAYYWFIGLDDPVGLFYSFWDIKY